MQARPRWLCRLCRSCMSCEFTGNGDAWTAPHCSFFLERYTRRGG